VLCCDLKQGFLVQFCVRSFVCVCVSAAVQLFTCSTGAAGVAEAIQVFRYDPAYWN